MCVRVCVWKSVRVHVYFHNIATLHISQWTPAITKCDRQAAKNTCICFSFAILPFLCISPPFSSSLNSLVVVKEDLDKILFKCSLIKLIKEACDALKDGECVNRAIH